VSRGHGREQVGGGCKGGGRLGVWLHSAACMRVALYTGKVRAHIRQLLQIDLLLS
jgi:hypothetical protein